MSFMVYEHDRDCLPRTQAATKTDGNDIGFPLWGLPRPTEIPWRPQQRVMHGNAFQLRGNTRDRTTNPPLLGAPHHGGMVRYIILGLVQRLPRVHSGRPNLQNNFNIGVYELIRKLVVVLEGEEVEPEVFGKAFHRLVALYYAENRLLSSPRKDWLQ